jgi:hypothetical protein
MKKKELTSSNEQERAHVEQDEGLGAQTRFFYIFFFLLLYLIVCMI